MTLPRALAATLCLLATTPSLAQRSEPGLWEHQITMQTGGALSEQMARMQQQMERMPPEQRRMMEQMLAQKGMRVDPATGTTTVQACLSKEDAERQLVPRAEKNCQQQILQRSGSTLRMRFECPGPPPVRGEATYTLEGPRAYRAETQVETEVKGQPSRIQGQLVGRWLSADCGAQAGR